MVPALIAGLTIAASATTAQPIGPKPPFTRDFFGMSMGADLIQASDAVFDTELNTMRKIGVHWVRASIPWSLVQLHDANGHDWTLVDRLVNTVHAEGMQLIGIIDNPPNWAGQMVRRVPDCSLKPPFDLQAYANFAGLVAARYGPDLLAGIEVENSPNLPEVWPTPDPCAYSALMEDVYPAVKSVEPDILVLNGGVGGNRKGTITGLNWIKALYANGAQGSFDALSFHPYSYPCSPSEGCAGRTWDDLPKVRQVMIDNGDASKQIWATEFGAPTSGVGNDGHVTEARQSSIMVDAMQQWAAFGWAGPFFAYEFRDYGTDVNDKSDWFGIVSNNMKHKKPAFFAYQYLATGKGSPPALTVPRRRAASGS